MSFSVLFACVASFAYFSDLLCYFCGVEGRLASICHWTQVRLPARRKMVAQASSTPHFCKSPSAERCRPARQPFLRCCTPSATAGVARRGPVPPELDRLAGQPAGEAVASESDYTSIRPDPVPDPAPLRRPPARRQGGPPTRHGLLCAPSSRPTNNETVM